MSNLNLSKVEKLYAKQFDGTAHALAANGLDWGVVPSPLQSASGVAVPAYGIMRTDNGLPVGVVGERYKTVSNRDACGWLDAYQSAWPPRGCGSNGGGGTWAR